jgi:hypothetical protein
MSLTFWEDASDEARRQNQENPASAVTRFIQAGGIVASISQRITASASAWNITGHSPIPIPAMAVHCA